MEKKTEWNVDYWILATLLFICLRFRHGNAECLLEIIRETGK
jgi:hypothetical protein